ncbi:MAG: sigma-70 family RNA polymerase sigma factor [Planctomycetes bacterium]|nr:sigma-70 family RNA polymerase sigma factor [Planctomycetota bacterium]
MMSRWETTTQTLDQMGVRQDTDVWETFSNHFFPAICRMARQKGLTQADAEDAAQQTLLSFMQAMRQGKYHRTKGRLSAFLFAVANRTILNARRRNARHAPETSRPWQDLADERSDHLTWETQWQKILLVQSLERIRKATDPQVFKAFDLYCLQERPAHEVAETLHITPNAVYIAKSRVLSQLRHLQTQLQDRET